MYWKWKRKWSVSLVVTFAILFSTVGTAAATGPIGPDDPPAITADTEKEAERSPETDENDEKESSPAADKDDNEESSPETDKDDEKESSPAADKDDNEESSPDTDEDDMEESSPETDEDDNEESSPDTDGDDVEESSPEADADDEESSPETDEGDEVESSPETDEGDEVESSPETDEGDEVESSPETDEDDPLEDPDDGSLIAPEDPDATLSAELIPGDHEHSWSIDWDYDERYHWHECDAEDCPLTDNSEKDGHAEHNYDENNICTVCGFDLNSQISMLAEGAVPTYQEAYEAMIALKDEYPEGMTWTNFTPYGSNGPLGDSYAWKGGPVYGASRGVGCSAFAFILSDAAFGNLPARAIAKGGFTFEDVHVGDILRVNGNSHSVIVLQKSAGGVILAEGNYNKSVHWGRAVSKTEVSAADHLITRYPKGYIPSDDPDADKVTEEGTIGSLHWSLTGAGTLTIFGKGAMPDFSMDALPPWNGDNVNTIVIEKGVTSIGDYAFYQNDALSVYIPDGITSIGQNAFDGSALISVTIPGTVKAIEDKAFHDCANLTSVTVSKGVSTIGDSAFQGCTSLAYIDLPTSVTSVGTAAFASCKEMTRVRFMPGNGTVTLGDNLFSQCWNLTSVTLPQTADRISAGMFQSCTSLPSLYIPASVTEVGGGAGSIGGAPFTSCPALKNIYFGGSETEWNNMMTPALTGPLQSNGTTVHFNIPFDDPFAADPNDPGDLLPDDEGGKDPTVPDDGGDKDDGIPPTGPSDGSNNNPGSSNGSSGSGSSGGSSGSGSSGGSSGSGSSGGSSGSGNSGGSGSSGKMISTTIRRNAGSSSSITMTQDDGTVATITTDTAGKTEIGVTLSALAVSTAQQQGGAASIPIKAVQAVQDIAMAPSITVHTGGQPVKVAIPTVSPTAGTVAVIVHGDGSTEVIGASVPTEDSVVALLPDGATVKIVDNSKSFADVPAGTWFEDAVAFVSARGSFYNAAATAFAPDAPMTHAVLLTFLADLDGAETDGGITWYAKSMEWAAAHGIRTGTDPNNNVACAELIMTLWTYLGPPAAADPSSGLVDAARANDTQGAMDWAVKNGIFNGFEGGHPDLQGQITRAQAAQMIMNLIKNSTLAPAQ